MSRPYLETFEAMSTKLGDDTFIVPAFWQCLHSLVAAKRSFSILFRTFGTDTDDVIAAFNAFCAEYGYHHLSIDKAHCGVIHRNVWGGHTLILGLKQRNPMDRTKKIKEFTKEQLLTTDRMRWYKEQQFDDDNIKMESKPPSIYEMMKTESLKQRTMILSDDYVWWSIGGEQSEDGKMLMLDSSDENVHQIFFDDNLEFDRSGIVDVRDLQVSDGRACISDSKWNELKEKYLLKVEPLHVILNEDYFIENIVRFESCV